MVLSARRAYESHFQISGLSGFDVLMECLCKHYFYAEITILQAESSSKRNPKDFQGFISFR